MIREALEDGLRELSIGLPTTPLPVAGSTLSTAPLSRIGWPATRRGLWERRAPPSAAGGFIRRPHRVGGVAAGVGRGGRARAAPELAQVRVVVGVDAHGGLAAARWSIQR